MSYPPPPNWPPSDAAPPPGGPPPPGWQPGPGPWPPPPGWPAPKKSRLGLWLALGGGVLAVIAVVVVLLVVNTGSTPSSDAQVRSVLNAVFDASNRGDLTAFRQHLCGDLAEEFAGADHDDLRPNDSTYAIDSVTVDGDQATATVTRTNDRGRQKKGVFELERHDGEWKVCQAN